MASQRKKRPQEDKQTSPIPEHTLFASPHPETATSENTAAEAATEDTTTLELRQQQVNQESFDFGDTSLFAQTSASNVPPQPALPLPLQAKLTVGAAGDQYEQEADRVAAQVVKTINQPQGQGQDLPLQQSADKGALQRSASESLQRTDLGDEEDIQRQSTVPDVTQAGDPVPVELEAEIQNAKGSGQALDSGLQQRMGQAMGADFSQVKIHTDTQADRFNQAIQAKAFTTGQDVFFQQGAYNPTSPTGQGLIAHELTHVVQQTGNGIQRTSAGEQISISNAPSQTGDSPVVQRVTEEAGYDVIKKILKNDKSLWKKYRIRGRVPARLPVTVQNVVEKFMTIKLIQDGAADVDTTDESKCWETETIQSMNASDFKAWVTQALAIGPHVGKAPSDTEKEAYSNAVAVPQGFYHVTDSESDADSLFTNGAGPCSAVALYAYSALTEKEIYAVGHIDANNQHDRFISEMIAAMVERGGGQIGPIEGVVSSLNAKPALDQPAGAKALQDQKARSRSELADEQLELGQNAANGNTYKYVIPLLEKHGVTITSIGKAGEVWMGKGYKQGVQTMPAASLSNLVKSKESVTGIAEGIDACLKMQQTQATSGLSLTDDEHEYGVSKEMKAILAAVLKLEAQDAELGVLKNFIKHKKDEISQTTGGQSLVNWAESDAEVVQ